MVLITVSGP
jgi:exonuclease III